MWKVDRGDVGSSVEGYSIGWREFCQALVREPGSEGGMRVVTAAKVRIFAVLNSGGGGARVPAFWFGRRRLQNIMQILKILFILLEVVILFNLLILVHEWGHFLAARWRGLKVERFGIWFGKPIWQKKINGVVYCLGSIPAGGYVALPQMAPMEAFEGKNESPAEELPPVSPGTRSSWRLRGRCSVSGWPGLCRDRVDDREAGERGGHHDGDRLCQSGVAGGGSGVCCRGTRYCGSTVTR
jgi:hypothetical protein